MSGWWWLEHVLWLSTYWEESSQLTNSYFSEGLKPPSSLIFAVFQVQYHNLARSDGFWDDLGLMYEPCISHLWGKSEGSGEHHDFFRKVGCPAIFFLKPLQRGLVFGNFKRTGRGRTRWSSPNMCVAEQVATLEVLTAHISGYCLELIMMVVSLWYVDCLSNMQGCWAGSREILINQHKQKLSWCQE